MPDPDPVAACLNKIRDRNEHRIKASLYTEWTDEHDVAEGDVRRLLSVVDVVLKPHQPGRIAVVGALCPKHENHRHFSITTTEAAAVTDCPGCSAIVYQTCAGCSEWGRLDECPVRVVITRELLSKENADG